MRTIPLLLLLPLSLSACSSLRSTFPSHDAVYAPIEPTIGEVRLVGNDTMYALSGKGWTLLAARRRTLEDLQAPFDGAAMAWLRTFGTLPPAITVRLTSEKDAAPFLTRDTQGANVMVVSTNVRLLPMLAGMPPRIGERGRTGGYGGGMSNVNGPPSDRLDAEDMSDMRASFLAGTLVHAWMSVAADSIAPRDLSSTTVAGNGPAMSGGFAFMLDARIPAWLAISMPAIFTNSEMLDIAPMQLARVNHLVPLEELVGLATPKPSDARSDTDRVLWPESLAFGQYVFEQEGISFFRDLFPRAVAHQPLESLLAGARRLPNDSTTLNEGFRKWVQSQSVDPMGVHGGGDR